ncbi:MAG: hypothetical protein FD180_3392 [Planctomycetota bacterium]|nr:MAG: hypothetical protein FD180_3392 [Planctomycetota bacterium]
MRSGNLPRALRLATRYATLDEFRLAGQFALACIYEETGDLDAMGRALDAAIGIDLRFPQARMMRAAARFKNEDYSGAAQDYTAVLEDDPSHWNALLSRGYAWLLAGIPGRAEEDLSRFLAFDPERVEAWIWRADALDDLGRNDEALQCLRDAATRWPEASSSRSKIEEAYRKLNR